MLARGLVAVYRVRVPVFYASAGLILAGTAAGLVVGGRVGEVFVLAPALGSLGLLLGFVSLAVGPWHLPEPDRVPVLAPVLGRWVAVNSPATKVPSHGVRAYGQAFAIDLVHEPLGGTATRPGFGTGSAMRPVTDYPAFGQPVRAMLDGEVVVVVDGQRDHRARSTTWGVVYMMAEGAIRELGGPRFVVGNHVVVRAADGVYALVAHLQRGSAQVRVGETVRAGQVLGRCGNSGNSSEPHVHAQLMDRASPWTGQGLPLVFTGIHLDDEPVARDGVPVDDQPLTVPTP